MEEPKKGEKKITNISSGKTYIPGIVISGNQVKDAGFPYGTSVKVQYEQGKITIHKVE